MRLLTETTNKHEAVPLYDFQRECLDTIHKAYFAGVTRQLIEMPTGSGKTISFCSFIAEFPARAVVMVHRDELVTQTLRKLTSIVPDLTVSICKAEQGRTVSELNTDVIIASAQTLAHKKRLDILRKAIGPGALLISDEAHGDMAPSRQRVINEIDWELVTGWTATPTRGDKQNLGEIYEDVVYRVYLSELVKRGLLAKPIGIRIGTSTNLNEVKQGVSDGEKDFNLESLEVAVNTPERNQLIHDSWKEHAWDKGKTRAVAFCVDVRHTMDLTATFQDNGVAAAYVIGTTPPDERRRIYDAFRDGTIAVLVSCGVLVEGWDEPRADCALMARPTASQGRYIQSVGRVLRRWPGKTEAVIIDFVDIFRHSLQSVTVLANSNTVTEADRKDGERLDVIGVAAEREERMAFIRLGAERVGSLIEDSEYSWQQSKSGKFVIQIEQDKWAACVPLESGMFYPVEVWAPRDGKTGYRKLFDRPLDGGAAMAIASARVKRNVLTVKGEPWRDAPPKEGQLRAAKWFHVRNAASMTRGELSDALSLASFDRAYVSAGLAALEKEIA